MADWNKRFIALADHVATWSKDESTKVGAVIVGPDREVRSMGYNGQVRGADDTDPVRTQRPTKYRHFEHAERNAIFNAARAGICTTGCSIYCTLHPCMDCARAIVQSGIHSVVTRKPDLTLPTWGEQFVEVQALMHETNVRLYYV